jgi:mRNA interferase MazF
VVEGSVVSQAVGCTGREGLSPVRVNAGEVSTIVRGIPTEVPLGKRDGLPKRCVANADSIVTIPKTWLESRIASLHTEKSAALDAAVRFALALS